MWNVLWWCHLFSGTFAFNMYRSDISLTWHHAGLLGLQDRGGGTWKEDVAFQHVYSLQLHVAKQIVTDNRSNGYLTILL